MFRKHRQVLLNSAHFLRLYNQSSQKVIEEFKESAKSEIIDFVKESKESSESDTTDILQVHGLRLLWDAFYNSEFLRSVLISRFLKSTNLFKMESLKYFEDQFIEKIYKIIMNANEGSVDELDMLSALFLTSEYSYSLLNRVKSNFSGKNLEIELPAIGQFYSKMSNYNTKRCDSPCFLFIERESNFCEFPQLRPLKTDEIGIFADLNKFKNDLKQFVTDELMRNVENGIESANLMNIELLKQLELDETVIETITNKFNDFKEKGNLEKLKFELFDLFDKLMKSIQASVRANETKIDEALLNRKDSVYKLLDDSPNPDILESLLKTLLQTLRNKSNIIFTIHRNELAALNSKRETNLIGSRLYLAIVLIRNIFNGGHASEQLSSIISELSKIFMDSWISDLQIPFTLLSTHHNELFALSWISSHFINLNVSFADSEVVLNAFGFRIQEVKTKYSNQAALLSGLFESQKVPSPILKSSDIPEKKSIQILPHFIPL